MRDTDSHRRLRIFVVSAAEHLTDHVANGEGLIAHDTLQHLSTRGHHIVACARKVDLRSLPSYEVVRTGQASRWESLEAVRYAALARKVLARHGGAAAFDVAWWMFPQGYENVIVGLPRALPLVVGPLALPWDERRFPVRAVGDIVRLALNPLVSLWHRRTIRRSHTMLTFPDAARVLPGVPRHQSFVPFAIDERRFTPGPLPDVPMVLFVGRLERRKGCLELLDAFATVLRVVPTARLVVAGDGELMPALKMRAVELGVAGAVEFRGAVPHDDVPGLLSESSVLALPSHGEPYGMAVLEAMAAGRAIVAVDAGGPHYLVDVPSGGVLVPARDPVALAAGIIKLVQNRQWLLEAGRHNRQRVEREFSWPQVIRQMEAVLSQAARP